MIGLLVYGSLVNPMEIADQDLGLNQAIPVRVNTYRRIFNQTPSWRVGHGDRIGVLNVERSSQHWINAVCLCLEDRGLPHLEARERGYSKHVVPSECIASYPGYHMPSDVDFHVFVGNEEYNDSKILPNSEYLDLCMRGAVTWGNEFYDEFVATTYLASGTPLRQYIANQAGETSQ